MRKFYLILFCLFGIQSAFAQPASFHISNSLRFVDQNNDTIPYPFLGGFVAPQFSEIDLNNDGIKDLFVFDRSGGKKMTFLNEGKGGQVSYIYAPSYEYYFPEMVHWVLLRDYNCDGKEDIFTCSDPSGVSVYKNVSTGNKPAFVLVEKDLKFEGMEVYSLSIDLPVVDDIDGDGDLDILAFDVFGGYATFFRNERVEKNLDCDSLHFFQVDYCWGSFVEASLSNDVFLGDNCFGWKYYKSAAVHSGSTMLTFDADGDGDKDLLIGDVDFPDFKLLINGKVETGWPYDTVTSFTNNFPLNDKGVFIDKFPAAFYLDVNNDGKKDFIAAPNEATAASNVHQNWWYKNVGQNNHPDLEFQDSSFLQDLTIDFGSRTQPAFVDIDGDGDCFTQRKLANHEKQPGPTGFV